MNLKECLSIAIFAALEAGNEIFKIYNSDLDFNIQAKPDNSPLTIADNRSNEVIGEILQGKSEIFNQMNIQRELFSIPILSEEGKEIDYNIRKQWEYFWLIDPLDGTKEFIKRNGEFTVNIALIFQSRPILGVVYVPISNTLYFSANEIGAYKLIVSEENFTNLKASLTEFDIGVILDISQKMPLLNQNDKNKLKCTIVASRSHMNEDTERFIDNLKSQYHEIEVIYAGSSLKICLIAEGNADIYPRLGPTMEWDTAAAHAIVNGAGKNIINYDSDVELAYNKPDLRNPWFVVK